MNASMSLKEPATDTSRGGGGGVGAGGGIFGASVVSPSSTTNPQQPSSLASLASKALPLQVVDTNVTSLVTPRLSRSHECPSLPEEPSDSCTRTSCLNGGKCVRNSEGDSRCICPGGSFGRRCKILSRTFKGNGWAWIHPFTPCLPTTISMRVLPRRQSGLILYSGPLSFSSSHPRYPTTPMMAIQLMNGRPQILMEGARGSVKLQVKGHWDLDIWHTLHIHIDVQGVTLMVDLCERGWAEGAKDDSHCIAKTSWVDPGATEEWIGNYPIQLGGLSHPRPLPQQYGWTDSPTDHFLDGCVSHFAVNGQLIDLGEPAYSSKSDHGCQPQQSACLDFCGVHGHCTGGLSNPLCECDPGWAPPNCETATLPATLKPSSFLRMAFSFTPDPYSITSQMRVRVRGRPQGLLMKLEDHHHTIAFSLWLRGGVVCASVERFGKESVESCLEGYPLGDGLWHTIYASRHGHNLLLFVDDGDGWRQNLTLVSIFRNEPSDGKRKKLVTPSPASSRPSSGNTHSLRSTSASSSSSSSGAASPFSSLSFEKPAPLVVDKQNGVTLGGVPEYRGTSLITVHEDISGICIDDIRVSGKALPLPPSVNTTTWGQVTTFQSLEESCPSQDHCSNITCLPPLSCYNTWRQASCGCGPGRQLLDGSCQMVDECAYQPCLHGGSCHDLHPGYRCSCPPYHSGDNCQWAHLPPHSHSLTPMIIAAITLSVVIFIVIGVLMTLRLHRSRMGRGVGLRPAVAEGAGEVSGMAAVIETPISSHSNKQKEELIILDTIKLTLQEEHQTLSVKKSPGISAKANEGKESYNTSSLRRSALGHTTDKDIVTASLKLPRRVTLCSEDVPCKSKSPETPKDKIGAQDTPRVALVCGQFSTYPPPAQDDLRAYAYEGDGSPSGSLTSASFGLCAELREEDAVKPIVSECEEVIKLLETLPNAPYTKIPPTMHTKNLSPQGVIIDTSPIVTISESVMDSGGLRGEKQIGVSSPDVTRWLSDNRKHVDGKRKSFPTGSSAP